LCKAAQAVRGLCVPPDQVLAVIYVGGYVGDYAWIAAFAIHIVAPSGSNHACSRDCGISILLRTGVTVMAELSGRIFKVASNRRWRHD
jgi:hypothetical protein